MSPHSTDAKPWFKSFWPWFVISLPAAGVIAGIATVIIAVQNAPIITDGDIGRFAREGATIETLPSLPDSKQ
jgi:hypothetical protein